MLILRFRQGAVVGASAGVGAGLLWLVQARGPDLGGPAVLGGLAGLCAGAVWLLLHRAELVGVD